MKTMQVKLTFIDELLGTQPSDPEIKKNYLLTQNNKDRIKSGLEPLSPAEQAEEMDAINTDLPEDDKTKTVFPRNDQGEPCLWSYQIRGFFKAACSAYRRDKSKGNKTKSKKLASHKKVIDQNIFVFPDAANKASRLIPIHYKGEIGDCQRPLRAATPQGERVTLANSESIPAGATVQFDIILLNDDLEDVVREWLDYGVFNGLGQWRNIGKGAFVWEEV